MRPEDFDLFANAVKQRSGLVLTTDKAYLLESRLPPVARKWSFKTIDELAHAVRIKRDEAMMSEIAEAMTTNESIFFRDGKPFERFRTILMPQFIEARAQKKQLRIWSAAASSGQEAYSLAMICAENAAQLPDWRIDIQGTDLSSQMIERAQSGIYSQFEVQRGLPAALLVKYFDKSGDKWQIREPIRKTVKFRTANLLHDLGPVGVFDIIFCRNLLVYFDPPTKVRVLNALAAVLAPDGLLCLGKTETALGINEKFSEAAGDCGYFTLAGR